MCIKRMDGIIIGSGETPALTKVPFFSALIRVLVWAPFQSLSSINMKLHLSLNPKVFDLLVPSFDHAFLVGFRHTIPAANH